VQTVANGSLSNDSRKSSREAKSSNNPTGNAVAEGFEIEAKEDVNRKWTKAWMNACLETPNT